MPAGFWHVPDARTVAMRRLPCAMSPEGQPRLLDLNMRLEQKGRQRGLEFCNCGTIGL